jgi:hypothetical protein
MTTFFVVLLIW